VILTGEPDAVLLIRRAEWEGDPWSGHIGLPGGRTEPADRDLLVTAIRETSEEVGVVLDEQQYLGRLDPVAPRSPLARMVVVHPHVFLVGDRPVLNLSHEVAEAFWVPLDRLRDPAVQRAFTIDLRGFESSFPAYHLPEGVVWGLTERILTPLLALLEPGPGPLAPADRVDRTDPAP
jgi:8-oxo-dGTP pyrophosphatase MutT (NUDIX family)